VNRHRYRTPMTAAALLVAAAGLGALAACDTATAVDPDILVADLLEVRLGQDLVFLAMRVTPDVHMDALFEGNVVLDDAGCLRLDSPDPATVVWPRGWEFEQDGGTIRILDTGGERVGRVGEPFALGGGEVETLAAAMGFTGQDRDLAESYCPGRYWIVAG
jgi:hypothetical protein